MDREDLDFLPDPDLLGLELPDDPTPARAQGGDGALPPLAVGEPPERRPTAATPDPAVPGFTWAMVGVICGISAMKIGLFLLADAGAAVATMLLGAAFVAAHGVILFLAASWFEGHRRRG